MNRYTYDQIQIGMEESFSVMITEEMMDAFQSITGDVNPLHTQKDYAARRGYVNRVVYGMLTASFLSTLAGVYLPGEHSLIQMVETRMLKPVYVGDRLTVYGIVFEKFENYPVITLKAIIKNQNSELVMRGKMQIGIQNE